MWTGLTRPRRCIGSGGLSQGLPVSVPTRGTFPQCHVATAGHRPGRSSRRTLSGHTSTGGGGSSPSPRSRRRRGSTYTRSGRGAPTTPKRLSRGHLREDSPVERGRDRRGSVACDTRIVACRRGR